MFVLLIWMETGNQPTDRRTGGNKNNAMTDWFPVIRMENPFYITSYEARNQKWTKQIVRSPRLLVWWIMYEKLVRQYNIMPLRLWWRSVQFREHGKPQCCIKSLLLVDIWAAATLCEGYWKRLHRLKKLFFISKLKSVKSNSGTTFHLYK
jgi:hypothetical protein